MISFLPDKLNKGKLDLLCLGAHCDDIEIGCGGTLLKWIKTQSVNRIVWVVFSSNQDRKLEAIDSARQFLNGVENHEIIVLDYRDAFLQYAGIEVKEEFEKLKKIIDPDIVFTHYRQDRHQDHRLLSDLAWNTFRNHCILEYEIPKYDGDLGVTNAFVSIGAEEVQQKIDILLTSFKSQSGKHWFDEETFKSLMRLRGLECSSPTRYAESFYLRKCLL
ncbi:MAG: PIG-L family deacetylase [Saprospiraceae bacterium]|nr:PIG-L family deacetylase [Saprospiraceae bacterium]